MSLWTQVQAQTLCTAWSRLIWHGSIDSHVITYLVELCQKHLMHMLLRKYALCCPCVHVCFMYESAPSLGKKYCVIAFVMPFLLLKWGIFFRLNCAGEHSLCNMHALYTFLNLIHGMFPGGTVDIDESELDVDEGVELVDSAGLPIREKMVYMSVGDAHQTQDDISECRSRSSTEIWSFDLLIYCTRLGLTHLGQSCKISFLFLSLPDTAAFVLIICGSY